MASVKDRAKMFSSNVSKKEIEKELIPKKNEEKKIEIPYEEKKGFFQEIWSNKKKRYIAIGIASCILITIIVTIIIIAASSKSSSSSTSTPKETDTLDPVNPKKDDSKSSDEKESEIIESELIKPDCTGVCERPYNIMVYSDSALKAKLKECGYKEGDNLFSYALSAIKRHNVFRACHNAQPLMFNCEIMEISQKYSEYLAKEVGALVRSNTRFHGRWMGENLAYIGGSYNINPSGEYPTNTWYNEIKYYNFNNPGFGMNTGHFTQVVWKDSKEFGIGLYCQNYKCFMTGNYFPGGNFNDAYATQVQNLQ